ncbi:MAG TPA: DsbA family protein [Anaerolineales bacterium]|nr:DsbA family protein [Anaerolineales bacterium]
MDESPDHYTASETEFQAEESPAHYPPEKTEFHVEEVMAPTRRSLPSSLWMVPLAFALGLAAGFLLWGWTGSSQTAQAGFLPWGRTRASQTAQASSTQSQSAAQGEIPKITRYDVPVDDDPAFGPADAAITIIEFSDYECPYCRSWHVEVFPKLMAAYPGQVRLIYRDFPIESIHPNATPAAVAANCAQEQGAYWEFNDLLFSMQLGLNAKAYQQYASQLRLDERAFAECVESDRYLAEVRADLEYAANLGVRSTPTFFVNGIAVVGAQPFELFQQLIDQELAGEIPK